MQLIIDTLLSPLTFLYEIAMNLSLRLTNSYVLSLFLLALFQFALFSPFKSLANKFRAQEQATRAVIDPQIAAIDKNIAGHSRHESIRTIFRRYNYHPFYAVRNSAEVLFQVPFFLAAYSFLSNYEGFKGRAITFISDLGLPDKILLGHNLLPLIMTAISMTAAFLTSTLKTSEQNVAAIISFLFLIVLYNAPAGLVLFWIANNIIILYTSVGRRELLAIMTKTVQRVENFCPKNSIQIIFSSVIVYFLISYFIHPNKNAPYVHKYLSIAFLASIASILLHINTHKIYRNWNDLILAKNGLLTLALLTFFDYALDRVFLRSGQGLCGTYETLKLVSVISAVGYFISNYAHSSFRSERNSVGNWSHLLLFPLLVGFGVVINFYFANLGSISRSDVLVISLALLSSVILLSLIFRYLENKFTLPVRYWYIFSICLLLIFYRPTLVAILKTPVEYSLRIQVLIVTILPLTLISLEEKFRGFLLYSGTLFLFSSILTSANTHDNQNSVRTQTNAPHDERVNRITEFKHKPNIYLLIYDSYVHNAQLKEYGLDNTQQEKFLEENGFVIYRNTYTGSVPNSLSSMSGVLDVAFSTEKRIPEHNLVNRVLKREGYNTDLVLGAYFYQGLTDLPAYNLFPEPSPTWLTTSFKSGVLHGEHKFNLSFEQTDYFGWLAKKRTFLSGSFDNPQFMYAHSGLPSHSQNSGACLPNETAAYGKRLYEANIEMKQDLQSISDSNRDSIVIIAGDHGPYLTGDCTTLANIAIHDFGRADILDRHGMFLAVRWPIEIVPPENRAGYALQELFSLVFDALTQSKASPRPAGEPVPWRSDSNGEPPIREGKINWGRDSGRPLYN